jgi:SulP family sulfate permease
MNLNIPFRPRLFDTLKGYTAKNFVPDLIAGVTVGIVVLLLAMAFAIASGVKPEAGIFIAVVAGFIISALDGTKVSIGGPTGARTPAAGIIHAVTSWAVRRVVQRRTMAKSRSN